MSQSVGVRNGQCRSFREILVVFVGSPPSGPQDAASSRHHQDDGRNILASGIPKQPP